VKIEDRALALEHHRIKEDPAGELGSVREPGDAQHFRYVLPHGRRLDPHLKSDLFIAMAVRDTTSYMRLSSCQSGELVLSTVRREEPFQLAPTLFQV
jgi:hypothetical protein